MDTKPIPMFEAKNKLPLFMHKAETEGPVFISRRNKTVGVILSMDVWSSHKDEVKTIPEEFEILASSTLCDVESFKHKDKDVYGIQFHPEVHHTPKGEIIFKNFYKICLK